MGFLEGLTFQRRPDLLGNAMKIEDLKTNILVIILAAIFFGGVGYRLGLAGFDIELRKNPPQIKIVNLAPVGGTLDFSLFWEAWRLLNEKSVEKPLAPKNLLYGALRGLAASLNDPYTVFLTPEQGSALDSSLNGQYEGVGAELGVKDNQLVVIAPLEGSPAQRIGVKAGDKILKIDDKETGGLSLNDAVGLIRGREGTTVDLTIQRGKAAPIVFKIKREKITVSSLKWEKKEGGLVYLRLSRFGEDTNRDWDRVVREILTLPEGERQGLVLDLRSNAGGYLDSAVYIASEFLTGGGIVVAEQFGDGARRDFAVSRHGDFLRTPVVVLVNQGTASAAEILAAALRDQRGVKLVGLKTFGKGSVQESLDLTDGSKLHVTVAKWLTPKGEVINGKGLNVDVEVDIKDEDVNNGKDPQLEKALEMARGLK